MTNINISINNKSNRRSKSGNSKSNNKCTCPICKGRGELEWDIYGYRCPGGGIWKKCTNCNEQEKYLAKS